MNSDTIKKWMPIVGTVLGLGLGFLGTKLGVDIKGAICSQDSQTASAQK